VDSYAELYGPALLVAGLEPPHAGEEAQRHGRHLPGVAVAVAQRQPRRHHVRVADRLHLVHVEVRDDGVAVRVQVVQEVDHLERRRLGRQLGEADDIASKKTRKLEAWTNNSSGYNVSHVTLCPHPRNIVSPIC